MSDTTNPLAEKVTALCLAMLLKIYAHISAWQYKVLNNKKRFRIKTISISVTISVIVTIRLNYKSESALPRCLDDKKKC